MQRFPESRVYRRKRLPRFRTLLVALLLGALLIAGWYFDDQLNQWGPVPVNGRRIIVADGDSFAIGNRKLRLRGIDAPEYRQTCNDSMGGEWPCGRSARAALEKRLTEPGLSCEAEAHDRYGRSLAICRTAQSPDIAAAQVRDGMAVSDEFFGSRSYGDEEYAAQIAKAGIWQGKFVLPAEWRARQK